MSKAVTPGQHGAPSQSYAYTRLADLTAQMSRVNVWAVVKFFKEPQRSRGTDYFQMFSLVDDSLDPKDATAKLVCVLFNAELSTFPSIRRIGDVIRLHRASIKPYTQVGAAQNAVAHPLSKLQAVSTFGFSWVVIDGEPESEVKPRSNAKEFTFSEADRARAIQLRNWYARSHVSSIPSTPSTTTVLAPESPESPQKSAPAPRLGDSVKWIETVGINNYFDVPVMLIGLGVKTSDRCILYVTDGSTMTSRNLPPFASVDPSELDSLKMDQDLYDKFLHYMVPIVVYDDHCQTAQRLQPGDLVFIKNLHCMAAKNQILPENSVGKRVVFVELILHGKTHFGRGLRKMSPDEFQAKRLVERIEALKAVAAQNRSAIDQSIGPFAEDLLHRQSRHHQSPPGSPGEDGVSPAKMPKSSLATSPSNTSKTVNHNGVLDENDDEWEIVRMRDVAIQTNLP